MEFLHFDDRFFNLSIRAQEAGADRFSAVDVRTLDAAIDDDQL
jgi:hypothetical protein